MQRTYTWLNDAAVALVVGGALAGCPMDEGEDAPMLDDEAGETTGTSSGGETSVEETSGGKASGFTVSGTVTRSATLPDDGDGVGTVVVGAFAQCDLTAPVVLGAAILPDADLSQPDASVAFSIESLASGSVFLVSFLDDDGNLDPMNPLPDAGDPVLAEVAGDGILTCIEVEIDDADVDGVAIDLNEIAMPVG